jgi:energy-converting hydrogenase Eha subunit F
MHRTISLHPASLVFGLVFGVLVLLSMSQVPPLNARGTFIQYLPHPRDYVQVREGTPYTVPAGKILTITATGTIDFYNFSDWAQVKINGTVENESTALATTQMYNTVYFGNSMSATPAGFTAHSGDVVEVFSSATNGSLHARLWGFLSDQ